MRKGTRVTHDRLNIRVERGIRGSYPHTSFENFGTEQPSSRAWCHSTNSGDFDNNNNSTDPPSFHWLYIEESVRTRSADHRTFNEFK